MNRLPAEWEAQRAILLTWPRQDGDFAANYAEVAKCFADIALAVSQYEKLIISFNDEHQRQEVMSRLQAQSPRHAIAAYCVRNNDVWARDHGPIGVRTKTELQLLDFGFDGWGGKHPSADDNLISRRLADQGAFAPLGLQTIPLVLEGGALETDGQGSLLATRSSVLDPARNPKLDTKAIERILMDSLGIRRFLWLENGALHGDDTDGHIDTLARFCDPETLLYQASGGKDDPNHQQLSAMHAELLALRTAQGQPYRLIALPFPGHHRNAQGDPLPAGYANFLIINQAVLLPTYGVDADAAALAILQTAFPDRRIIGIDCRALIRQYGSLHCVTMNLPA